LCELLTMAMAQRDRPQDDAAATDPVRGLRVSVRHAAGRTTRIASSGGTLTLHDTAIDLDVR
jgi:hypothetical protein